MTALNRIEQHLKKNGIRYEILHHTQAFSAQRLAQAEHVPGKMQVKVVVLKSDRQFHLAVLPAVSHVDLKAFSKVVGQPCQLATETEFKDLFPDCELGTMPPFGSFYGLPVYADLLLEEDDEIVCQAGTHTESIKMSWDDFVLLESPTLAVFGYGSRNSMAA